MEGKTSKEGTKSK